MGVGSFCGWIFLNAFNNEKMARAQAYYEKGEALFKQKDFKEAMWNYEMVGEFYSKPHTNWLDLAQEKEWICRAYLGDWTPSKGPTDGDVRVLQLELFEKYKTELASITPIPQSSSIGK